MRRKKVTEREKRLNCVGMGEIRGKKATVLGLQLIYVGKHSKIKSNQLTWRKYAYIKCSNCGI